MKKKSRFARYSMQDKALLITGYILLGLFVVAIIIPMIYIIVASFMDPITLQNKGITFDFEKWTLTAYNRVMSNAQIWVGFKNAVIYSVVFTVVSVFVTLLAAYPMSRADFKGKGFFNTIFVITMFFGGGVNSDLLINQQPGPFGQHVGDYPSGCVQCMEYDYSAYLLSGYSGRTAGSCGSRRGE